MATIKRCKSCRLWLPEKAEGTRPKRGRVCYLRLREMEHKGEKVVRPTMQLHDSEPGPYYMKHVGPGFVCQYYVPKHSPLRVEKKVKPERLPIDTQPLISVDGLDALGKDVSQTETHTLDGDDAGRRDQVRDGGHA